MEKLLKLWISPEEIQDIKNWSCSEECAKEYFDMFPIDEVAN